MPYVLQGLIHLTLIPVIHATMDRTVLIIRLHLAPYALPANILISWVLLIVLTVQWVLSLPIQALLLAQCVLKDLTQMLPELLTLQLVYLVPQELMHLQAHPAVASVLWGNTPPFLILPLAKYAKLVNTNLPLGVCYACLVHPVPFHLPVPQVARSAKLGYLLLTQDLPLVKYAPLALSLVLGLHCARRVWLAHMLNYQVL